MSFIRKWMELEIIMLTEKRGRNPEHKLSHLLSYSAFGLGKWLETERRHFRKRHLYRFECKCGRKERVMGT